MTARRTLYVGLGLSRATPGNLGTYNSEELVSSVVSQMRTITDSILKILKGFEDISPDVMLDALQPTFDKSQLWCPVDTGAMKESGYLQVEEFRGNPRVEIGYGAGGVPYYTAFVHENMEQRHQPPTRSKWLQAAIMEDLDSIEVRLGEGYKAFMDGIQ